MRVEIHLADSTWAEVLTFAEEHGTTVARVIEAALRDAVRPSSIAKLRNAARRNQVLQAWGEGLTDAAIAERTGEVRGYVAGVRRSKNLPPHSVRRATGTRRKRA
ncbi:hypothetical protein RR49_01183 [Microbacterium ginsengisoli]|uniref:Uncharacterized protein n=1 Tax=Microbacterium ginsengisoli TaxID=400772 RepID=A0A0F0M099_9MICO|nr:hypothetical protein RR49_01183 [Microbacterium ginsengisoli]